MRIRAALAALFVCAAFVCAAGSVKASACVDNPNAIGTARTLVVDPRVNARIGSMQYAETLALAEKEVVLTFDDGPVPPYTARVLDILARECVKATFFIVGRQARAFPELVRRIHAEGHTIGTHSENHPFNFARLPAARARAEIDDGFASTAAALGATGAVAPFFRFPGLKRSPENEQALSERGVMTWSADFPADDWRRIGAAEITARALERLERKGRGVLLLHDIQPATLLALPGLLRELKSRGYGIVHVEPERSGPPRTITEPERWVSAKPHPTWPRVLEHATAAGSAPTLAYPSAESFGWPEPFRPGHLVAQRPKPAWPSPLTQLLATMAFEDPAPALPVPSPQSFGVPHPFGPHIEFTQPAMPAERSAFMPEATRPSPVLRHPSGPVLR